MPHLARTATIAAVLTAAVGCGVSQSDLALKIVDARTGAPVSGATVTVNDRDQATNDQGLVHFLLRSGGAYGVAVSDPDYLPLSTNVALVGGAQARTIQLYPRPDGPGGTNPSPDPGQTPGPGGSPVPTPLPSVADGVTVMGRVTDEKGNRVANALVQVRTSSEITLGSASTSPQGEYRIPGVPRNRDLKITAVADGLTGVTRVFKPTSDWRMDFSNQFALKAPSSSGPGPSTTQRAVVQGTIVDTFGHPLDGVVVHVESANVRYPFDQMVLGRQGRYHLAVPTELSLRFTASKSGFRATTFVQTVPAATMGLAASVDFTGARALDLLPVNEPGIGALSVAPPTPKLTM